ncbi:MAG: hypothetical protein WC872_05080, partial [Candidatus Absconditabacterales bacterium]
IERIKKEQEEIEKKIKEEEEKKSKKNYEKLNENNLEKNIIYLSSPDGKRNFHEQDSSNKFKDGESVYEFKLLSDNKAEFSIVKNINVIRRAFRHYDLIILPVCDITINNMDFKYITVDNIDLEQVEIVPGEVEKEGNIWKVIKRGKIIIVNKKKTEASNEIQDENIPYAPLGFEGMLAKDIIEIVNIKGEIFKIGDSVTLKMPFLKKIFSQKNISKKILGKITGFTSDGRAFTSVKNNEKDHSPIDTIYLKHRLK